MDYQTLSIQSQMELFISIRTGSFPLYVPGFAYGNSSSTLTLGQLYHPIAYIASVLPGYWSGKALEWNTFLRLLSLGITHLALFAFLRKLKLNMLFAFLLSFITVYNLRMLDLFRYSASLEAYTGYLLLCTAIGSYFINPAKRLGPLSIIGLTYWLVCSGHAQMMYYGLLGAGLFTLVIPFFISTMLSRDIDIKVIYDFWGRTTLFLILGILLSMAYILPFYFDFIVTNVGRVGQSYAWSDSYRDTFIGTLNSFFLPFRSDVHGNFGGSSLFIIALILPMLRLFRVKIPNSIWAVWAVLLLSFMYMQGARIPVHRLAWEYLPFASSFRIAGRVSLIIPIFIMMILAWLVQAGPFMFRLKGRDLTLNPFALLALLAIIVMAAYSLAIAISIFASSRVMFEFAHFIPVNIRRIPHLVEILVIVSGAVTLITLVLYNAFPRRSGLFGIILCIATFVQVGCILKYGTWVVERRDKPTFDQILSQKKEKLDYRHHPGSGLYSSVIDTQIKSSFIEPYLGKLYFDIIPVSGQEEGYAMMQQDLFPQRVYVEDYKPEQYAPANADKIKHGKGRIELVYSSFNRLRFRVFSSSNAFFSLSYPYTGHWNAWVTDRQVRIYRSNGAACGVTIPAGESIIEFRYWSNAAFRGMLISTLTLLLISLYFCFQSFNGIKRALSIVTVFLICIGFFILWYHSLYSGDNLGTEYIWTYKPPLPAPNIAYGKKTSVSSALSGGFYIPYHSSKAVDGDLSPGSGFSTAAQENPFLVIDLGKAEKIRSIVLYESGTDRGSNTRPLLIEFSLDAQKWNSAKTITSTKPGNNQINTVLEPYQTARYVRIQAAGYCRLSFDEVEVYGPEDKTVRD